MVFHGPSNHCCCELLTLKCLSCKIHRSNTSNPKTTVTSFFPSDLGRYKSPEGSLPGEVITVLFFLHILPPSAGIKNMQQLPCLAFL